MTRWMLAAVLAVAAPVSTWADGPKDDRTPQQRKELEAKAAVLTKEGEALQEAGKLPEAAKRLEAALELRRKLFPASTYPDGHADLAHSLANLASVLDDQGQAGAEPLYREALAMRRRLYPPQKNPDGHPELAESLNDLAVWLDEQGRPVAAEPLAREALAMRRRLFPPAKYPDGHPELANSVAGLASVLKSRGRSAEAEPMLREALAMRRRLFPPAKYPDGHVDVSRSLNDLALWLDEQGRPGEAEPLFREALAMDRRLYPVAKHPDGHPDLATSLSNLAHVVKKQGRPGEAEPLAREALAMRRRLFPPAKYPDGHADLALSLSNLALLLDERGRPGEAEPLYREALAMNRRLYPPAKYPDGHPDLVGGLDDLAGVLQPQGQLTAAESLYREALAMRRRLFPPAKYPDGHRLLALGLTHLASVLDDQGRPGEAETLLREALAMCRRLYPAAKYADGHADLAFILTHLAIVLDDQGRLAEAEPLYREALAVRRRLYPPAKYPDGHRVLAISLNNLAFLLDERGQPAVAEPLYREALAIYRRLYPPAKYPDGHPDLALGLNNLAFELNAQGRPGEAEPLLREALAIYRARTEEYTKTRSDGDALTLLGSFPAARDVYLSLWLAQPDAAAHAYAAVWSSRAIVTRVMEVKHLAARSVGTTPETRALWEELSSLRRRRAELILAQSPQHPDERKAREHQLEQWATRIAALDRELRAKLPDIDRTDATSRYTPADLQAALPAGAVFIDLLRYTHFTYDPAKPGKSGQICTPRYVAFVIARQQIERVDLGPAEPIEAAVSGWLTAISRNAPDGAFPATLRTLIWDKLAARLPAGVSTVYLAPDQALARVPWAALPGAKPGTVLLEDHALVTVPHGQFLLSQLTAPAPSTGATGGLLVVGGVRYGDAPAPPPAGTDSMDPTATRAGGGSWRDLPGSAREAEQIAALAAARQLPVTSLTGAAASPDAVRAALPKARVAHLATHGFFADPKFRSVLQVDPKLFEMRGRERVGAGALSPLVLSGLVFAGANRPDAPGRGLLTGEALVGLDLSGLDLAVLSACETGLGDVAGGEGVFGLQKAFHLAGCKNVVASLWKVDDDATAALMGLFYRHLWVDKLPPREALRRAQLTLYRHPELIATLAKKRGADFTETDLPAATALTPAVKRTTAKTSQWAAFMLSGAGR